MVSARSIVGWGAVLVFSSVNFLQALNLTCPGATDLVLKTGTCKLNQMMRFECVEKENAVDFRSCVPGKTTAAEMSSCTREAQDCLVAVDVRFRENAQCSSEGASGMNLAQGVPCP